MIDTQVRFVQSADIVSKQMPNQVIILELDSGEYFSLEEVGLLVWTLLDGEHNLSQLVAQVCRSYDVSESEALQDVSALLEELLQHGVVRPA